MLNALKSVAVLALLALGVTYIFASSLDFQNCVYEYGKANPDAKYFKEGIPVFIRSIPIYRHCVGEYVTSKHDVITAVFTIVIAIFTTVLAIFTIGFAGSTRLAAHAAVTQANAIINAERPYVFFKITKPGLAFPHMLIIPDTDTMGRLHYELINAGRTPAMLEEVKEIYTVIEGITDAPAPIDPMKDRGRLLPVGTISTTNSPFSQATNLFDEKNAPDIRKMMCPKAWANRRIFCQGFIRYFDAFGNHYITGFLAAFSPQHAAWALRGGKQYNYSRQENPRDIPPHPEYPGE